MAEDLSKVSGQLGEIIADTRRERRQRLSLAGSGVEEIPDEGNSALNKPAFTFAAASQRQPCASE
jgi:hypothetical protein